MGSKPTRGPWRYDAQHDGVLGPDDERVLITGFSMPVGNHPQAREAEANARLCAAAPDLLAACEEALAFLRLNDRAPQVQATIRGAIAKATGEQAND